jgi:hypothetical protein
VPSFRRPAAGSVLPLLGLASCLCQALAAAPEEPGGEPPVSLERIRAGLEKPNTLSLALVPPEPVARPRFKSSIEERNYMLSFEEQLRKDLEPTLLLRQSRDWASRCCGMDLSILFKGIEQAWDARKQRKIREQIARELEELQAATAKPTPPPK